MATEKDSPQLQSAPRWRAEFDKNLRCSPTARVVWTEVRRVGLEGVALRLLCAYSGAGDAFLAGQRRELKGQAAHAKATARAERVLSQKKLESLARKWRQDEAPIQLLPQGADFVRRNITIDRFRRRAEEKQATLSRRTGSNWPPEETALALRMLSKPWLSTSLIYLDILRREAAKRNVRLGSKRLAALAECANPNRPADPATIARYLRRVKRELGLSSAFFPSDHAERG